MFLSIRESQCVPGTLGAFTVAPVLRAGEIVTRESPFALSLDSLEIDQLNYNSRFGWSIVEEILKATPRDDHAALVEQLIKEKYARGLGDGKHWEDADTLVLQRLAAKYNEKVVLLHTLYDIIVTNALTAELASKPAGTDTDGRVVVYLVPRRHGFYKTLSRINHSCTPNAVIYPPQDCSGPLIVRALRPIAADEEVTINYLNKQTPMTRAHLVENFGFTCACPVCRDLCNNPVCKARGDKFCPCSTARYCSRACQVAHWRLVHHTQCTKKIAVKDT